MIGKFFRIPALVTGCGIVFSLMLAVHAFGAGSSVDERIKALEETVKTLQTELTRAKDVQEIANLQARYCAIHNTQEELSWTLFADRPDTSKEITMEKTIGFDNIKAAYFRMAGMGGVASSGTTPSGVTPSGAAPSGAASAGGLPSSGASAGGFPSGGVSAGAGSTGGFPSMGGSSKARSGIAHIHPVGTPCIVVADDGKTAKATFTSLGFEGGWCYGMYANSYIKIDGKWYIWHMKWLRCFKTDFYKSWDDQTIDEIYEFTQGQKDEWGFPKVNTEIDYSYLNAPGKIVETITAPKPYATWTKEDEDGGWWKKETKVP